VPVTGDPPGHQATDSAAAAAAGTVPGPVAELVLDQAFNGDSLYALRSAAAAHAAEAGLPPGRVTDLVLAVHELAGNAVRHGGGRGRLRMRADGQALHCEVTDSGPAPARAPGGTRGDAQWPVVHGHGLWVIRQLADQVSVRSGPDGTIAAVTFGRPLRGRACPP
jgi:anti-sigma regulatory factor (Ser/Thr protein kinase)